MPYIPKEKRSVVLMHGPAPNHPGELNFLLTKMIFLYLPDQPTYADYNEVIGVLECVKLELYRRHVAPYEDKKIEENGDVFKWTKA